MSIGDVIISISNFIWDFQIPYLGLSPLLLLLMGGGLYFLVYSRFLPFRHFWHGVDVLRGKYDDKTAPGDLSRFQALASSLAATVGMGNISGVAIAIVAGGPGALFWMWISAVVGMATKFFECVPAVMYRRADAKGQAQGGPMYMIEEGLGKQWRPLAVFFAVAGLGGSLPLFQANQLTQVWRDMVLIPNGWASADDHFYSDLAMGVVLAILTSGIIFGGIRRIGQMAATLVPAMVALYSLSVLSIIVFNITKVPAMFYLIITDAFTGQAVAGGVVGAVIITGVRRATFSNEAGIGTAALMHGATRSREPVREGFVAMLGPFIDTIVVCTMTALAILITDAWRIKGLTGITVTAQAFGSIPYIGVAVLIAAVLIFALTTLFSYSYYGTKCLVYLLGARFGGYYNYFYIGAIIWGATADVKVAFSLIDLMYAMMAVPTIVAAVMLSPKVMQMTRAYCEKYLGK